MSAPKLTIGMAHHTDFHGVYFTIQALRLSFPHLMPACEIVVVDQSPENAHGKKVEGLLKHVHETAGVQYVPFPEPAGTSPSRDKIFAVAKGDAVLVMDCHVLLQPRALDCLMQFYARHPQSADLTQGPLLYDDMRSFSTHFDDEWGAEMWGRWGSAWRCRCGRKGTRFSLTARGGVAVARLVAGQLGETLLTECAYCHEAFPAGVKWEGHEAHFHKLGYRQLATELDGEPFPIPGQGLGLFSCRRSAWQGFHPEARGFGGEELYIHQKFRDSGYQALCLPGLRWVHRFGRPDGVPYSLTRWGKLRNYVLEFQERGWSLAPVYEHFVASQLVSEFAWEKLVNDAVGTVVEPKPVEPLTPADSLDTLFTTAASTPRDLDQHLPKLRELAALCPHVTEFSGRKESTIAFAAAQPETLWSYSTEVDAAAHKAHALYLRAGGKLFHRAATIESVPAIDETDLLFLDTRHTYQRVKQELETFGPRSRRFIVLHDTQIYGERGEDGGQGILKAVTEFLAARPEWAVIYHTRHQHGLTVLSCVAADRPEHPVTFDPQGPGTELKKILESLGVTPTANCACNQRAEEMNNLGVEGCRAKRDEIAGWLREGSSAWGWREKLAAAASAVAQGLAFRLNVLDPYPGLVDEAIRRAAEREQKRTAAA